MDAARAESGPVSTAAFRQAIDQAFFTGGYVGYRDMYDYASNVHAVVDTLEPSPAGYRRLCENARKAGVWDGWRDRTLTALRASVAARIAAAATPPSRRPRGARYYGPPADASYLVEVFLFEGDVEQAWAEAQAGGCSDRWWTELARLRQEEHPADAIPIWQAQVERAIQAKNNGGYQEAVELMAYVKRLMSNAGQAESFPPYAAQVRATHKPKRNLMKLFEQRGW